MPGLVAQLMANDIMFYLGNILGVDIFTYKTLL